MINIYHTYGPQLKDYLSETSGEADQILIISPFINLNTIDELIGENKNAIIITSWRADHLASGTSTLELYPLSKNKGWRLYVNDRIHAKIYSRSMVDCFLGSANCTNRALFDSDGNIETLLYCPQISSDDRMELFSLISNSLLVTDEIYAAYKKWFEEADVSTSAPNNTPSINFERPFTIMDLPATDNPIQLWDYLRERNQERTNAVEHDIAFYGPDYPVNNREEFLVGIKENYFKTPFIKAISNQITEKGMQFGRLSEWIHNNCIDVPTPYRKDVKTLVHNVFCWFEMLAPDQYKVRLPGNHSQVIFRLY